MTDRPLTDSELEEALTPLPEREARDSKNLDDKKINLMEASGETLDKIAFSVLGRKRREGESDDTLRGCVLLKVKGGPLSLAFPSPGDMEGLTMVQSVKSARLGMRIFRNRTGGRGFMVRDRDDLLLPPVGLREAWGRAPESTPEPTILGLVLKRFHPQRTILARPSGPSWRGASSGPPTPSGTSPASSAASATRSRHPRPISRAERLSFIAPPFRKCAATA